MHLLFMYGDAAAVKVDDQSACPEMWEVLFVALIRVRWRTAVRMRASSSDVPKGFVM